MEIILTIIIILLVIFLIGLGVAGIFIPFLPDIPLILTGALVYGLWDGFERVGIWTYAVIIILGLFVTLMDYFSTTYGAKKFGATKYGIIGGVVGAILGLMAGWVFGLILGFIIGAILGELMGGGDLQKSFRAGAGALLGFLGGTLVKLFFAIVMVVIFVFSIIF